MRSYSSGSKAIHVATNGGNLEVLQWLVDVKGCDPRDQDKNNENCLSLAIKNKKRNVASWLIKSNRFEVNTVMEKGFNYFAYALVKGQHVIADEIL